MYYVYDLQRPMNEADTEKIQSKEVQQAHCRVSLPLNDPIFFRLSFDYLAFEFKDLTLVRAFVLRQFEESSVTYRCSPLCYWEEFENRQQP